MITLTPLLTAAFVMGFFGSPHCLGMCGGLVTAFGLSMQAVSPLKKRALIATYHLGRLLSYSFLGIIAGTIGTTVLAPLMNDNLPRILLGLVLVFIGLTMMGAPFLNKLEKLGMGVWKKLSPLRQKVFPLTTYPRALGAGLLWGFLPCGLVYGALLMAVVGHDMATGALLMFVFGLGTVPMLVATHETVGWLHKQIGRFRLRQLNGVIMILSGIAIIAVPLIMGGHGGHAGHSGHNMHSGHMATMPASDHLDHMTDTDNPMSMETHNSENHHDMHHNMSHETDSPPLNHNGNQHDSANHNNSHNNNSATYQSHVQSDNDHPSETHNKATHHDDHMHSAEGEMSVNREAMNEDIMNKKEGINKEATAHDASTMDMASH